MGWFEEQLEERARADREALSSAYEGLAHALLTEVEGGLPQAETALEALFKYLHIPANVHWDPEASVASNLEAHLKPQGIMKREVLLKPGWNKDAQGAYVTVDDEGRLTVMIPSVRHGYRSFDGSSWKPVDAKAPTQAAFLIYRPLPQRPLTLSDLVKFSYGSLTRADMVWYVLIMGALSLVALITPWLTHVLFSQVVGHNDWLLFGGVLCLLVASSLSTLLLSLAQQITALRLSTRARFEVEAATMMRMLSLPVTFYRAFSSGELMSRQETLSQLISTFFTSIAALGLSTVFSLCYVPQIMFFAPTLVVPALAIALCELGLSLATLFMSRPILRQQRTLSAQENGITFDLMNGVQKIRLSGAQARAFNQWAYAFAKLLDATYKQPRIVAILTVINTGLSSLGALVMMVLALQAHISVANFYAFTAAWAALSAGLSALQSIAQGLAQLEPTLKMVQPILDAQPETNELKPLLASVSGGIELSHISFRYDPSLPYLFNNFSLSIKPGEYVALVGKTGCGKSTLVRLMLGFEQPQRGAVLIDSHDISTVDLSSLRQHMGVVMQQSQIFSGSIFHNIIVAAPQLTMDDAWAAAELAGLADDIRSFPMGMHTMLTQGGGGISGGQRQRLLIARAIAHRPRILIMDEATSALDNITQRQVSQALDSLKCTRVIIAHRLSTIKHCQRIIVLDQGVIAETGTYDELIEANGIFAELVAEQRLDA